MDLLGNYNGSDSDDDIPNDASPVALPQVSAAPVVVDTSFNKERNQIIAYVNETDGKLVGYNLKAEEMWAPIQGPAAPQTSTFSKGANAVTGHAEVSHMNPYHFSKEHQRFHSQGYAANPSILGDAASRPAMVGPAATNIMTKNDAQEPSRKRKADKLLRKKRLAESGRPEDVDEFEGPWATYLYEEAASEEEPLTEEQIQEMRLEQQQKKQKLEKKRGVVIEKHPIGGRDRFEEKFNIPELQQVDEGEEMTIFHGDSLTDYQGRTYLHIPTTIDVITPEKCYVPKACVHTWKGHSKGVSAIRFFPQSGHLLLSGSMDRSIKLWDVYNKKNLLRTFIGHQEAVRDVNFSNDGSHFVSASYDRYVKYWDTETGQCIGRYTTGKVPICAVFHPDRRFDNEFLVGQADNKIVQWDVRVPDQKEPVQTYNEHLKPVNHILFIDNNTKFVSSSDDRKICVWEYGIPVVTTHIAGSDMSSAPYMALHPSGESFITQSQNNEILVYNAQGRVSQNRRKVFRGHLNAGYAAQLGFSPDGSMVISGDAQGRIFFWDWKTMRVYKSIKAHTQVSIGCVWNPNEPRCMATCSWDGKIKYWR